MTKSSQSRRASGGCTPFEGRGAPSAAAREVEPLICHVSPRAPLPPREHSPCMIAMDVAIHDAETTLLPELRWGDSPMHMEDSAGAARMHSPYPTLPRILGWCDILTLIRHATAQDSCLVTMRRVPWLLHSVPVLCKYLCLVVAVRRVRGREEGEVKFLAFLVGQRSAEAESLTAPGHAPGRHPWGAATSRGSAPEA